MSWNEDCIELTLPAVERCSMTRGCLSDLDCELVWYCWFPANCIWKFRTWGDAFTGRIELKPITFAHCVSGLQESSCCPGSPCIALVCPACFFFRQMLKQFFLHLSVIHILFDLAPSLAWDSSYSIPRYSKHWLRVQLTHANPQGFRKVKSRWFPHLATWLPGYLATWLGYYLCHHHWEMAWRFCLKVNPRLGKRSHGRPCPIGFTGESTGFLAPKRIPEKALEFGCRTYTRQFVYVCLNLEILLGDLGAYACDECAGASFWYGWHFAESHAQSSKSDDQRKHFPWPDPEFNHK